MSKWISVDERLPKLQKKRAGSKDVLVIVSNDYGANGFLIKYPTICAGYLTMDNEWYTYMNGDCCKVGGNDAKNEYSRHDRVVYWRKMPKFKPPGTKGDNKKLKHKK